MQRIELRQKTRIMSPDQLKITVTIDKASSVAGDVPENTQKTLPKWHKK